MKKLENILKNDKAVKIIVAVGFGLILLIFISDLFTFGAGTPAQVNPEDMSGYKQELEAQLASLVSEIEGVSRVKVMVTLESMGGIPKVRGAAVVCGGGDDVFVKQRVVETVSKVLGISTARVSVTY